MHRVRQAATLALLIALLSGGPSCAAPYDLVPRGDWSYDVLARWAARGLIVRARDHEIVASREFHGDEPLTREAMAAIVSDLARHADTIPSTDRIFLVQLVREFTPEIQRVGGDPTAMLGTLGASATERTPAPGYRATGFALGRLGSSSDDGATARGVYRAAGLAAPNAYLLGQVSLTNARQLFSTDAAAFPDLENYVVRLHTRFADWELGKNSQRWGPGWGGTMLLSDDAPALFRLSGRKRFSLGFLGPGYTFEQFVATLDDLGGRRYIVARRLSRPFGRRAGVSISEAVKTSKTRLLPVALVLPLYLATDLTFNEVRNSNEANYLAGFDLVRSRRICPHLRRPGGRRHHGAVRDGTLLRAPKDRHALWPAPPPSDLRPHRPPSGVGSHGRRTARQLSP